MTKKQREKSVAIAKDVIKHIRFLDVQRGRYIEMPRETWHMSGQMQKALPLIFKKSKPCQVCALGACMISHVNLYDKFKMPLWLEYGIDKTGFYRALSSSMGARNMTLIECAFECNESFNDADLEGRIIDKAVAFGSGIHYPSDRLKAIMRNIIKNDGEFKP